MAGRSRLLGDLRLADRHVVVAIRGQPSPLMHFDNSSGQPVASLNFLYSPFSGEPYDLMVGRRDPHGVDPRPAEDGIVRRRAVNH